MTALARRLSVVIKLGNDICECLARKPLHN
jgi:hypothetical protein